MTENETTTARQLVLPANVAALAKLAPKDSYRYALRGVLVRALPEGRYRVESTDGRVLGRVEGPCPADYPREHALAAAPNGAASALVPAADLQSAAKLAGRKGRHFACVLGEKVTTFAAQGATLTSVNEEGRWPATDRVFPHDPAAFQVRVDPALLAQLLEVARQFADETGVVLEFRGSPKQGRPVTVRARNGDQEFTGLLMPLSSR